ncbi:MAG TPA: hypothetical protein VNH44_15320 [Micropepsaceae bacterium]|nr:hypothetical protein [Micropepsaceae bacterium]
MAMTWLKVVRSDGGGEDDDFYMDGDFIDKAGTIGKPLRAETGDHIFEIVDAQFKPLWRKQQVVDRPQGNSSVTPVTVTLEQVIAESKP